MRILLRASCRAARGTCSPFSVVCSRDRSEGPCGVEYLTMRNSTCKDPPTDLGAVEDLVHRSSSHERRAPSPATQGPSDGTSAPDTPGRLICSQRHAHVWGSMILLAIGRC